MPTDNLATDQIETAVVRALNEAGRESNEFSVTTEIGRPLPYPCNARGGLVSLDLLHPETREQLEFYEELDSGLWTVIKHSQRNPQTGGTKLQHESLDRIRTFINSWIRDTVEPAIDEMLGEDFPELPV